MTSQSGDGWVLYVEPAPKLRDRITARFADEQVSIEAAGDVAGGRQRLAAGRPACIISEYDLPSTNGIAFLESVRETYSDVPFVLFTDSGNERIASEAVTAGVSEYIPKTPVDEGTSRLLARVQELMATTTTSDSTVAESLKDQAMDRAPVGITIADVQLPDEPLIHVNDAFERLTGYSAAETLGRNCRFLQGESTDPEPVAEMRAALENDDATAVELRNYTKDGTEFWNRVEIAPIRSADGEVTHYVGYQTDVSARKEAEIEARERAEQLRRKQSKLESLLARIEGLLWDVSEEAIHARTVGDIKQQVCEAFVDAEGYSVAWIGEDSPGSDPREIDALARKHDGASKEGVDPEAPLVERAVTEGRVSFEGAESHTVPDDRAWGGDTTDGTDAGDTIVPDSTRAAVPVTYGETTYGALGIHTDGTHTFDEHEAVVLSTIGRIVGTAINAVRTQSLVQSEAVIELELTLGPSESLVGLTSDLECRLTLVGTVPAAAGSGMVLFFDVADASPADVTAAATKREGIESATVISTDTQANTGLIRISIASSPLVDVLVERGGTITAAEMASGTGTVTVQLAKDSDTRTFVEEFEDRVPGATLQSYRDDQRPARTNQEFVNEVQATLTDRQREALRTAYVSGFFDWPRKVNGDDVATAMDISRPTYHQHLRAAQRKLLDAFYDRG